MLDNELLILRPGFFFLISCESMWILFCDGLSDDEFVCSYLCILNFISLSIDFFFLFLRSGSGSGLVWFSSFSLSIGFHDGFLSVSFWIYPFYQAYIYARALYVV